MFIEHDINGERGLLYLLKDTESLQSFHIGMLATNFQMGAIPLQCTYYESREAVYFRTGHLISVEKYLNENRAMNLSWMIKGLSETVKQLMSHQLFPENISFDSQHVFLDLQNRSVHLIYIPLRSTLFEAKSKLCQLLREWIELYVNHSSSENQARSDFNPMMVKLLLTLQQETASFNNLLEVMSTLGLFEQQQEPINLLEGNLNKNEQNQGTLGIFNAVEEEGQRPLKKIQHTQKRKENPKIHENPKIKAVTSLEGLNRAFVSQNKKGFILVGLCLVASLVLWVPPIATETKLGSSLIICALGVWAVQKFRLFTLKKVRTEQVAPSKEPPRAASVPMRDQEAFSMERVQQPIEKAEETVWIDQNRKSGVLMLRSELGSKFITLNKEITTIGRNPSLCDVLIEEVGVGRVHAEIHKAEDKYYIKDIQSLNGSFVNGRKIPTNQYFELKTGDQIKVGTKEVIFT